MYKLYSELSSHFLHLFCHLVGVEDTRHLDLNLALLILGSLEGGLTLLQEQVGVVLSGELPDLNEEVPQMLLESGDVLVVGVETSSVTGAGEYPC